MKSVIGWCLGIFGIIGYAVEVGHLLDGTSKDPVVGFVMATLFTVGGFLLVRSARRAARESARKAGVATTLSADNLILRVARDLRGRVTATEVAASTTIPLLQAQAELERLAQEGFCELLVTSAGVRVFRFPEFENADAKRDVLELSEGEQDLADFDSRLGREGAGNRGAAHDVLAESEEEDEIFR